MSDDTPHGIRLPIHPLVALIIGVLVILVITAMILSMFPGVGA